ncbi:MAG: DEAD/DEAH box helicase family protein [Candidatus Caldarchaeum sp.]
MSIVEFAENTTGWKLLPHQKEFLEAIVSNDRENYVITAPRGSGKTTMAAIICAYYLTHYNNYSIVIAAGSREQASRLMGYLHQWFYDSLRSHIAYKTDVGKYSINIRKRRNKLTLIASSEKSRRGEHANMLIIDEAESIEEDVILDYLGIPTLDPSRILVFSTPAWDRTYSFFRNLFHEADSYGFKRIRWTADEARNVPGWNTAYEREKMKIGYNKAWFKTQWEADVNAVDEGLVFHNIEKCVVHGKTSDARPKPVAGHPIRIGVDWGYTHHTAVVVAQRVGRMVNVVDSFGFQGVPFITITQHLRNKYREYSVYTDDIALICDASAMGAEKVAELTTYNINTVGVPFVLEKISYLIPNAVSWVENSRVRIWEGEKHLLSQLSTYYWETSGMKVRTKKTNDDYVDAFMLALRDWRYMDYEHVGEEEKPASLVASFYDENTENLIKSLGIEA